jgi:hypothetical protein
MKKETSPVAGNTKASTIARRDAAIAISNKKLRKYLVMAVFEASELCMLSFAKNGKDRI